MKFLSFLETKFQEQKVTFKWFEGLLNPPEDSNKIKYRHDHRSPKISIRHIKPNDVNKTTSQQGDEQTISPGGFQAKNSFTGGPSRFEIFPDHHSAERCDNEYEKHDGSHVQAIHESSIFKPSLRQSL